MDRGQEDEMDATESAKDPLFALFGQSARALFEAGKLVVTEGALGRLPGWMRSGALADVTSLCKSYRGVLEVARGRSMAPTEGQEFIGSGGQVRVSGTRPEALLQLGLTVFFADIRDAVPGSRVFLAELEAALGVPPCSVIGVFVNAPGSGLPMHHDSHDQLLIQLSGEKDFTYARGAHARHPGLQFSPDTRVHPEFASVYGRALPASVEEIEERGLETVRLKPGSALFLPAGCFHRTTEQSEVCMSLSIAVRPPSYADLVLGGLRARLLREERFRAPSYGQFGADADLELLGRTLREASEELTRVEPRALCEIFLERLVQDGDPSAYPNRAHFSQFLRIPSTKVRFETAGPERTRVLVRLVHRIEENRLEIASVAERIVRKVMGTHQIITKAELLAEFDEFDEEDLETLLDDLARVGLLRPVAQV